MSFLPVCTSETLRIPNSRNEDALDCYSFGVASDVGRRRATNEDSTLLLQDPSGSDGWILFAVADGLGGLDHGELASRYAVEELAGIASRPDCRPGPDDLLSAFELAHKAVRRCAKKLNARMATTMVAGLISEGTSWLANVGDSRAYLLRESTLRQITDDHSLVAESLRAGLISPTAAEHHPSRHLLTRSLGAKPKSPAVDIFGPIVLSRGDSLVLCSDGLHGLVPDEQIEALVVGLAPQDAADALVAAANDAGGPDNISVIVVRSL